MFPVTTSLHIEFNEFNGNIFIIWCTSSANPQFNVISCSIGQVLCKPWRVVELTACAVGCTAYTIPENIIGVEYIIYILLYWKKNVSPPLILQRQMSKYAVGCQHLHESDLHHQHSSHQFLDYSS